MNEILWLARIFGPFLLIMGLWALLRTEELDRAWNSMKANPGLFFLGGVLNLLVGLSVLSTYSSWSFGLPLLLTLFGWLWVIRGCCALFAPDKVIAWADAMESNRKPLCFVPIVWGFLLCILAFF